MKLYNCSFFTTNKKCMNVENEAGSFLKVWKKFKSLGILRFV